MELKSGVKAYRQKVVRSGDVYEIYQYENPVFSGYESKGGRHHQSDTLDEVKEINREKVLSRAQKDIRRIVNSNFNQWGQISKFLTLTFKEDVRELDQANYEFKKFKQRLEYEYKIKLKYTLVPEFTKKGRAHFHTVIYNMPYIPHKRLMDIWGNGGLNIKKIDHVDNVGAYICKYLTKDTAENLKGKKCYSNSRGLKKPLEITNEKEVAKCVQHLTTSKNVKVKFQTEFQNDYTGKIKYMQCIEENYTKVYTECKKNKHLEVEHE